MALHTNADICFAVWLIVVSYRPSWELDTQGKTRISLTVKQITKKHLLGGTVENYRKKIEAIRTTITFPFIKNCILLPKMYLHRLLHNVVNEKLCTLGAVYIWRSCLLFKKNSKLDWCLCIPQVISLFICRLMCECRKELKAIYKERFSYFISFRHPFLCLFSS